MSHIGLEQREDWPDVWSICACLGRLASSLSWLLDHAGSAGKTTTAWLIRGIFEEWGKLTGMAGTIENAIYADKLDADGNLWTPDEPDPTLDRWRFDPRRMTSMLTPKLWLSVECF